MFQCLNQKELWTERKETADLILSQSNAVVAVEPELARTRPAIDGALNTGFICVFDDMFARPAIVDLGGALFAAGGRGAALFFPPVRPAIDGPLNSFFFCFAILMFRFRVSTAAA